MKTNEEKVVDIMNFSKYGAIAQIFVIHALSTQAKLVANLSIEDIKLVVGDFIPADLWKATAVEIAEKLSDSN